MQRGTSSSSLRQRSGTSTGSTLSKGMTSSSATKRGAQSASMQPSSQKGKCESCGAGATMSRSLRPRSGSSDSDGELDISLTSRRRSGSSKAAGEPAASQSTAAAASCSVGVDSVEQGSKGGPKKAMKGSNPWNQFQHAHKGRGLSSTSLAQMYKKGEEEER